MESTQNTKKSHAALLVGPLVGSVVVASAWAGPDGERVVSGQASFSHDGATTLIRAADNTIINYRSFNIGAQEAVRFIQPGEMARVLNRITTPSPTHIDGTLIANGQVFFANPAGVYFGAGSTVNVGTIYAAAGQITNRDFLSGINRFTGLTGEVVNAGIISGDAVHLVGRSVENTGSIFAGKGVVTMLVGDEVVIGEARGHLFVKLKADAASTTPRDGVENAGRIEAGRVHLASADMFGLALHGDSVIKAGEVTIEGGDLVEVSGEIDATDHAPGAHGGHVEVLGDLVALEGASIDASGDAGGGTVLIGGDYQGKGSVRNAERTYVDAGTTIRADATGAGDGGRVIVWSDRATGFAGTISARGGAGGDGGFAEVSGKDVLVYRGSADLRSPGGEHGTLLLDPKNITIDNTGGDALTGNFLFTDNPGSDVTFIASDVVAQLNLGNVELQANNDITVDATGAIDSSGGVSHDLTLSAGRSITLNADITLNGAFIATANHTGAQAANRDAGASTFTMADGVTIDTTTANGDITINLDVGPNGTDASGDITLGLLDAGTGDVLVVNNGPTAGSGIVAAAAGSTITAASVALDVAGVGGSGEIGTVGAPIGLVTTTAEARAQSGGLFLDSTTQGVTIGGATLGGLTGLSTSGEGEIHVDGTGGAVTITEAVTGSGAGAVTITSGGAMNVSAAVDSGSALITLSAAGNVTVGATVGAATTGGVTITADNDGDLAGTLTTSAAIGNASAGGVTLTGDDLVLGASVSGAGDLTLQPSTTTTSIAIGDDATGDFAISDAELANVSTGFNQLFVGWLNGQHAIDIDSGTTLTLPLDTDIRTPSGGSIAVNSDISGVANTADLTLAGSGATTTLNGNITTSNANIWISDAVVIGLGASPTITTTGVGKEIQIDGTIDGQADHVESLTLDAGSGNIILGSRVGTGVLRLSTFTATTSGTLTLTGNIDADNITLTGITGSVTLAGDSTLTSTNTGVDLSGATGIDGAHNFAIDTGSGAIGLPIVGNSTPLTSLTLTCVGLSFGGNVTATNIALSGVGGSVSLLADSTLTATNNPVDLSGAADINGARNFAIDAGSGAIGLPVVGNSTPLTSLTLTSSGTLTFNGNVTATDIALAGITGPVVLAADTTLTASNNALNLGNAGGINGAQALAISTGNGAIDLPGVGAATPLTGLTLTSSGIATLNGNITTNGGTVSLNAPVSLGATIAIDTTNAGGAPAGATITFGSTLDGTNDLALNAGTGGNIAFTGVVGATPLADVTITNANNVTASAAFSAASVTQSAGQGTTRFAGTLDATGATGLVLNGTAFRFDSAVTSSAGPMTVTGTALLNAGVTATGQTITFNGAVTIGAGLMVNASTGTIDFNSTVTAGANALTLQADEIDFGAAVTGTSTLTLVPSGVGVAIGLGGGAGTLNLDDTDLGNIGGGFTEVIVGVAGTGTHEITAGAFTFDAPMTINAPNGTIRFNGTASTSNDTLTFNGPVTIENGLTLDAGTATLDFNSTITADGNALVLRADAMDFGGTVTGTSTLTLVPSGNGVSIGLGGGAGTLNLDDTDLGNIGGGFTNVIVGVAGTGAHAITAGAFTFDAPMTINAPVGTITLGGTISMSNDVLTFNGPVTIDAGLTLDAVAGSLVFNDTIAAGAFDLVLSGDEIDLAAAVTGTGALTLQPGQATTVVTVGGSGAGLDLTSAEVGFLVGNFTSITIGRSDGTGAMAVAAGGATFTSPVELRTPGGTITIGGALVASGITLRSTDLAFAGGSVSSGAGSTTLIPVGAGAVGLGAAGGGVYDLSYADLNSITAASLTVGEAGTTTGGFVVDTLNASGNGLDNVGPVILVTDGTLAFDTGPSAFPDSLDVTALAGITLNAAVTTNDAVMTFNDPVTVAAAAAMTLDAGTGEMIFVDTLDAGVNDLVLSADEIDFAGNVTGTGTLTLRPSAVGVAINVGFDSGSAGVLDLAAADIGFIQSGFSQVVVGIAGTGAHAITVGGGAPIDFSNPVVLEAPSGSVTFNANTTIAQAGAGDSVTIDAPVTFNAASGISTNGATILLSDTVALAGGGAATIDSNGGLLHIVGAVTGQTDLAEALTLDAGTGIITLDSTVGTDALRLASLELIGSGTTTLTGDLDAGTYDLDQLTGSVTIAGNMVIQSNDSAIDLSAIGGGIDAAAAGVQALGLDAGSGTITLPGSGIGLATPMGAFTATSTGSIVLGGAVATAGGAATFNGPVTLSANSSVDTTGSGTAPAGATITFADTLDGGFDLALDAGTSGNIDFDGIVGATPLADVTITNANNVTADAAFSAGSVTQSAGQGTTRFASTLSATGAGGINLTGTTFRFDGTVNSTGGPIVVTGTAQLNADISVPAQTATFNGAVGLLGGVTVASGNLTFNGTVDGSGVGGQDLTIDSTGSVVFAGAVGGSVLPGAVTIDATDTTLGSVRAGSLVVDSGTTNLGGDVSAGTIRYDEPVTLLANVVQTGSTLLDFRGAVTGGGFDLTANSPDTRLASVVAGVGKLTTDEAGTTTIGADVSGATLDFNDDLAMTAGVTLTGTTVDIGAGLDGGGFTQSIAGAEIDLGGGVSSVTNVGVLILGPINAGDAINVGSAAGGGAALDLSQTDLDATIDGITSLRIGSTSASHTITVGATTFNDPMEMRTPAGLIDITGQITANGNASLLFTGTTHLGADIVSAANAVLFPLDVLVTGPATIDTTAGGVSPAGAGVTFSSALDGAQALTLAAGTGGSVTFQSLVGAVTPLGVVTIQSADTVTAAQAFIAASLTQADGAGLTRFADTLTTTGAVDLSGNAFQFDGVVDTGGSALTVSSATDATFNAAVTNAGDVSVTVDDDADTAGASGAFAAVTAGSFSATAGADDLLTFNGPITTTTGGVTINGPTALGADIVTAGQPIAFTSPLTLAASVGLDTTNGGAVATGAAISLVSVDATTAGAEGLSLDAGTAGTNTLAGPIGATTALGDTTITGATSVSADITLGTGRTLAFASAVALGSADRSLTADEIDFAGGNNSVTGTGTLTLMPTTAATAINVGSAATTNGALDLDQTDLSAIADGLGSLVIGRADGGHVLTVGTTAVRDPLTLRSPNGTIAVQGPITGTDNASLTFDGPTQLGANLTTASGNMTFMDPVTLTGPVVIEGGSRTLFSAALAGGGQALTLTGNAIDFAGGGDSVTDLSSLLIQPGADGDAIAIGSPAGFGSALDISDADLAALDETVSSLTIGRAAGTHTIGVGDSTLRWDTTLRSPSGVIRVLGAVRAEGGVPVTFNGPTTLSADLTTVAGALAFTHPVTLGANAAIDTTDAGSAADGADATFADVVDAQSAGVEGLTLALGTGGAATFNGAVGQATRLGDVAITSLDRLDAPGVFRVGSLTKTGQTGTLSFGGVLDADGANGAGFGMRIEADRIDLDAGLTSSGGAVDMSAANPINLAGNVTTSGHAVTLGSTTLDSTLTIDTTNGGSSPTGAGITLGAVSAAAANTQGLTLDAGTGGDIALGGVVGFTPLGSLTIANANDVDAASITAVRLVQQAGGGTSTFSGTVNVTGTDPISLTGTGFLLDSAFTSGGGGLAVTGSGLTFFGNSADFSALGGPLVQQGGTVRLGGTHNLDTTDTTIGGRLILDRDMTFTVTGQLSLAGVDSDGTPRALALSLGAGSTTRLNGPVGNVDPIESLSVTGDATGDFELAGTVISDSGMTFDVPVLVVDDAMLWVRGTGDGVADSIVFNSTVDGPAIGPAGVLTVIADTQADDPQGVGATFAPLPVVTFGSDVGASVPLAGLNLNTTTDPSFTARPVPATMATITAGQDLDLIVDGPVNMGRNEKLTVLGDLLVRARSAELGDITTLGDMEVRSFAAGDPSFAIMLLERDAGQIWSSLGILDPKSDVGVDYVAGGTITFGVTPTTDGTGLTPTFSTPTGSGISATITNRFPVRLFKNFAPELLTFTDETSLDLKSDGPTNTNISEAIAGAAPRESQTGTVAQDTAVGRAQQEELIKLGLRPRDPGISDLIETFIGRAIWDDYTNPRLPGISIVTVNRLSPPVVNDVLDTYRKLFWTERVDEAGQVVYEPRREQIRDILADAIDRFDELHPDAETFDASAFRAYVMADEPEAGQEIRNLQQLLSRLRLLGLSPRELNVTRTALIKPIQPESVSAAEFEDVLVLGPEPTNVEEPSP